MSCTAEGGGQYYNHYFHRFSAQKLAFFSRASVVIPFSSQAGNNLGKKRHFFA
jgi:hypothetical protein